MNGILWFKEIDTQFLLWLKLTHPGTIGTNQVMSLRLAFHSGFMVTVKFFRDNDMTVCNQELGWDEYAEAFKTLCTSKEFENRCAEIAAELSNRN